MEIKSRRINRKSKKLKSVHFYLCDHPISVQSMINTLTHETKYNSKVNSLEVAILKSVLSRWRVDGFKTITKNVTANYCGYSLSLQKIMEALKTDSTRINPVYWLKRNFRYNKVQVTMNVLITNSGSLDKPRKRRVMSRSFIESNV